MLRSFAVQLCFLANFELPEAFCHYAPPVSALPFSPALDGNTNPPSRSLKGLYCGPSGYGSTIYYTLENGLAQYHSSACEGKVEKTGTWQLSGDMRLRFFWNDQTTTVFKIRSVIENEMVLEKE